MTIYQVTYKMKIVAETEEDAKSCAIHTLKTSASTGELELMCGIHINGTEYSKIFRMCKALIDSKLYDSDETFQLCYDYAFSLVRIDRSVLQEHIIDVIHKIGDNESELAKYLK